MGSTTAPTPLVEHPHISWTTYEYMLQKIADLEAEKAQLQADIAHWERETNHWYMKAHYTDLELQLMYRRRRRAHRRMAARRRAAGSGRMNRLTGGVALLAVVALTGCTPIVAASTYETVTVTAVVVAVVDGDTIDIATEGETARVRLIGIDTPEIGRGGEASECYADEARAFLEELLHGQEVELVSDTTQADVDKYGRLLRYVYVDGQSAAELAIAAGAGYEYTYDIAYVDQDAHRVAETAARSGVVGVWGACS